MAGFRMENEFLIVEVDSFGAELKSIRKKQTNAEYMWNGNPAYWKRTSPVLFPLVGALKNGKYIYEGREYAMSQHGFARDREFQVVTQREDYLEFRLQADEETLEKYPFHFELRIGYRLTGSTVKVYWNVKNEDEKEMYFSIGGHPAFRCPIAEGTSQTDYSLHMDTDGKLISSVIGQGGVLNGNKKEYLLEKGFLQITEDLFDEDALVIENSQAKEVSLCRDGKAYVTVRFDAPVFGIWSPPKKKAPFICIEPWYGRCDSAFFQGALKDREWGNMLESGEEFHSEYEIAIY